MTSGPSPAGPDVELLSKLRGLERLHIVGIISDATYNELRAKLQAGEPAASPAPAPTPRWSFGPAAPAEQPAADVAGGWSVRESPRRSASAWQATQGAA